MAEVIVKVKKEVAEGLLGTNVDESSKQITMLVDIYEGKITPVEGLKSYFSIRIRDPVDDYGKATALVNDLKKMASVESVYVKQDGEVPFPSQPPPLDF